MRTIYHVNVNIANAGGLMGGKIKGAAVDGEMYIDGTPADFDAPAGKTFAFAGKVLEIRKQEAVDLLKKHHLYDAVVGQEVGGVSITLGGDFKITGSWENDKVAVVYSGCLNRSMDTMTDLCIKIRVKGFFNSKAINNVEVVGGAVRPDAPGSIGSVS